MSIPQGVVRANHTKVINGEVLTVVFSDEFNEDGRRFDSGRDSKWEASDLWYDRGDPRPPQYGRNLVMLASPLICRNAG